MFRARDCEARSFQQFPLFTAVDAEERRGTTSASTATSAVKFLAVNEGVNDARVRRGRGTSSPVSAAIARIPVINIQKWRVRHAESSLKRASVRSVVQAFLLPTGTLNRLNHGAHRVHRGARPTHPRCVSSLIEWQEERGPLRMPSTNLNISSNHSHAAANPFVAHKKRPTKTAVLPPSVTHTIRRRATFLDVDHCYPRDRCGDGGRRPASTPKSRFVHCGE